MVIWSIMSLSFSHLSDISFVPSRRTIGPILCVLSLFYLGFHTVSGERGLFALFKETRRLEALQMELAAVKTKRQELESRVSHLSSSALDLDMLDEQVRRVNGLAGKDELVVFIPTE